MRYPDIDTLDVHVEKVIKSTVRHYYTDWKNYDRPKYMRFKGSKNIKDKKFLILVRTCGTYIVRCCDIYIDDWATTLINYFTNQEPSFFYEVDLTKLSLKKIKDMTSYLIPIRKEVMKNEKRSA